MGIIAGNVHRGQLHRSASSSSSSDGQTFRITPGDFCAPLHAKLCARSGQRINRKFRSRGESPLRTAPRRFARLRAATRRLERTIRFGTNRFNRLPTVWLSANPRSRNACYFDLVCRIFDPTTLPLNSLCVGAAIRRRNYDLIVW